MWLGVLMNDDIGYLLMEINRLAATALIRCKNKKQRKDIEDITDNVEQIRAKLSKPHN